jgi:hypothetical protein
VSHWDEFSKSLAEPLPRRESLRRLGLVLAGAVVSPLGLQSASAGRHPKQQSDPCKAFCKCRNRKQQDHCLKTCKACGNDPGRLSGGCGSYFCCGAGLTSCGSYRADLGSDPYNCGACDYVCDQPGPYEQGACINGRCEYACAEGGVDCNGFCTFLAGDPGNCGACGNACPSSAPYCNQGECICPSGMAVCDGNCIDIQNDPDNCGACGAGCPSSAPYCHAGVCSSEQCAPGLTFCYPNCVDLQWDNRHCAPATTSALNWIIAPPGYARGLALAVECVGRGGSVTRTPAASGLRPPDRAVCCACIPQ